MRQPARASCIALLFIAACGKSAPSGDPGDKGSGGGAAGGGAPNAGLSAKLGAGIECLNRHSGRIFEARDSYLEDVDPDKGPDPTKELHLLGLYATQQCVDSIKAAVAATPAIPELDQAETAYAAALTAIVTLYEEQEGYYKKGDYRTDGGKKGTEAHPKLLAAFEAFAAAHRTLDARIGTENRKVREADLAAREKASGRKLDVVLDSMMLAAETLVETVAVPPADLLAKDVAAVEATIAAYAKGVDEFAAYLKAHPDEAQAYGSRDNLVNYSQAFLGATRAVMAKVTAKTEPTEAEVKEITRQYNSLVDNYNR